jgi:hypothetical protein
MVVAMSGFNPYAPPSAENDGQNQRFPGTGEPLFIDNQIVGATFLGSPIAGFIVMAINEKRMGRPEGVTKMVGLGLVATVVVMGIGLILPDQMPGFLVTLAYLFGMRQFARASQGPEVMERLSNGAPKGSGWVVAGVGLGCLVGVIVVLGGLMWAFPQLIPEGI